MSPEQPRDEISERAILEAIEALERNDAAVSDAARPYLETLGVLPYQLEPLAPRPAVKEALMDAVERRAGGESVAELKPEPASPRGRGSSWMMRIAAMLAMALAGVSALQYLELSTKERRIERLAETIAGLEEELRNLPVSQQPPAWMVASGTELCALNPRQAASEESKGWLFVRQDHQHWYVAVEGLEPSPEGHFYELWFVVEGELVSGGTLEPDGQGRASLSSETMPGPVTGIAVTLEPDNGDGVPSETMVLYGDEVMLTL